MDKSEELVKNTVIIAFGKICTQLISFLLLPVYTSLLSTRVYGFVDLLSTMVSFLIPIITLQIEQAAFRYLIDFREDNEKITQIISSCVSFTLVMISLYISIFAVVSRFINNEYKYFLLINVIICILFNLSLEITRGLGKNKYYALAGVIAATTTLLFNILFVVGFRIGAYGILAANFLGNFIGAIFLFVLLRLYKLVRFNRTNRDIIRNLLNYSLPLVPNNLSWWVINNSDRTIITILLGVAQNGVYSAANKFSAVYISMYNIFNMSWTEAVAVNIDKNEGEHFFSHILNNSIRLFAAISIGIVAVMPFLFHAFIDEKFYLAFYQIPLLMIAAFLNTLVGLISTLYIAKKLTVEIAKTSAMAAVINIVINLVFIRWIGLYAASLSTIISYGCMLLYRLLCMKRRFHFKLDHKLMLSIAIVFAFCLFAYYITNTAVHMINLIIVIIYSLFLNRSFIRSIIEHALIKFKEYPHES